jgi:arsenate reductase (glutaredoxin)
MRKIYYLSTCDTCKKILKILNTENVELIDIKYNTITEEELDSAAQISGSYESLFNKRAQKLKILKSEEKPVSEADFRKFILSDYTFMKRPLAFIGNQVIAGNDKDTVMKFIQLLV